MDPQIFGYTFVDPSLLETALTTPAYRMEKPDAADNQRLEFLGDAVLELLASDRLYREGGDEQEGRLSVRRTHMVSTAALCEAAMRHGLRERLRQNRGAQELPDNSKTLADAVEAVIGAAWIDGGQAAAETVFEALELRKNERAVEAAVGNPKGALQEFTQAMDPPRLPEYTLLKTAGVAHKPIFTVKVAVEGMGEATAEARTRKEAEAQAAANLLNSLDS